MTMPDRFPKIFKRAASLQPNAKRVMSFGCSSGEECFSLARYFKEAEIVGVDINHSSIQTARNTNKWANRISFHKDIEKVGNFDVVTSLMVFFSMWQPIPVEKWLETIHKVDKHINQDGLWVIYTSQFPFQEARYVFQNYDVVRQWTRIHPKDKKEYYSGYYRKRKGVEKQTIPANRFRFGV